ncbi:MAG: hypothetical protein ABEK50_06660, partial [bacterium]
FADYPETRSILKGMIRSLGIFPVGCLVRLNNQDLGIVFRNHPEELRRPVVIVIKRGDDNQINEPYTVDLKHVSNQKELINNRLYNDSIRISEVYGLSQTPEIKGTVESLFRNQGFTNTN